MTPIQPSSDPITQQLDLEKEMSNLGIERFNFRVDRSVEQGVEDRTDYGLALLDHLLIKMMDGLATLVSDRVGGKAGRSGSAAKYLANHTDCLDVIAYLTLRMIIATLTRKDMNLSTIAGRIGRAVEEEMHYRTLRGEDEKLYQRLVKEARDRNAIHVKRKVVNIILSRRGDEIPEPMPAREAITLGMTLIEVVINTTGMVEKHTFVAGKADKKTVLVCSEETREFIQKRTASAALLRPLYEPMIVPPAAWSSPYNGGYLSRAVRPIRLVKTRAKGYLQGLESADLTPIYDAVNTAQNTAWTINPFILTALEVAWERDYSLGGVPGKHNLSLPPKPYDIDTNEEARKEWRRAAATVHQENREIEGKRIAFLSAMGSAIRYSLFPTIYMPYQLDFRGRIYAVPQLNPQGPDYMKALLMFAEGKPLDEDSAPFLAIHLANCGDFGKISKAPLEDRVAWVYANEEAILACADNPLDNRWWTEADSPYCFLAACREWAGWCREGVGFVSHIPVALDGSCSGIQHFSMALADEVGGAAVNLVPSDKPADIYSLVMNQAVEQVCLDASTCGDNQEIAKQWLRSGLLTRSCFKRPTMTYGYGSSQFGFRDQIESDTLKPALKAYQRGEGPWFFDDNGFKASLYLARITQQAVERTVVKAAEAMAWLKKVAGVITSEGLPVKWTTPDGFPVVQHYREIKSERIDTVIFGSRVRLTLNTESPKVSKRAQASGLSPNFVHSLDATHLRVAVLLARAEGMKDFALVHDSFGVHAADTGRFFAILREAMVAMYTSTDVIEDFYHEIRGQLSIEKTPDLPSPPVRGTLDLTAVVDCDFAFA